MSLSPLVVQSIVHSIGVTLLGTVLSAVVALVAAFAAGLSRLASSTVVRAVATAYVEIFRGASAIVLLFWAFYILPAVGITLPPLLVGVLVLGLNAGAYASEIVRGAVLAVSRGQWEAATALNMSPSLRMWKVILPQAVPTMLPSFGNILIDVLKGTSLFSLITITDLTRSVDQLALIGAIRFPPAFTFLLLMYFALSLPFMGIIRGGERLSWLHGGAGHTSDGH